MRRSALDTPPPRRRASTLQHERLGAEHPTDQSMQHDVTDNREYAHLEDGLARNPDALGREDPLQARSWRDAPDVKTQRLRRDAKANLGRPRVPRRSRRRSGRWAALCRRPSRGPLPAAPSPWERRMAHHLHRRLGECRHASDRESPEPGQQRRHEEQAPPATQLTRTCNGTLLAHLLSMLGCPLLCPLGVIGH